MCWILLLGRGGIGFEVIDCATSLGRFEDLKAWVGGLEYLSEEKLGTS